MRLVDNGSFQQVPQVDDSILAKLQKKFGLIIGQDNQLDEIYEKAT